MSFSVGILYSVRDFLKLVKDIPEIDQKFPDMFSTFTVASPKAIFEISQRCEWVSMNFNGHLEVTSAGQQILDSKSPQEALRLQLSNLIEVDSPSWTPLISRGRSEAMKYLPQNIQQCFREADLLDSTSDEVIFWWDVLAQTSRKQKSDKNIKTGRLGEKLSMQFEERRTKRKPLWQAIESNLLGYDLLSIVNPDDNRSLRIEVKTTNSILSAGSAYITKTEWIVAETSEHYVFHLWVLYPKPKLHIVEVEKVSMHIPKECGKGQWENVKIPFSSLI